MCSHSDSSSSRGVSGSNIAFDLERPTEIAGNSFTRECWRCRRSRRSSLRGIDPLAFRTERLPRDPRVSRRRLPAICWERKGANPQKITFGMVVSGLIHHPVSALRTLTSHSWNLWANTSGAGFIGLFTALGAFMAIPTLLLNNFIDVQNFSYPTFQNIPEFIYIALGTVGLLALDDSAPQELAYRTRSWQLSS